MTAYDNLRKRGMSPIIATVILIVIALIIIIILYFAFKSLIKEQTIKFDKPISEACGEIDLTVDASYASGVLSVTVQNSGSVPIYGIKVLKKSSFSEKKIGNMTGTTTIGDTNTYEITTDEVKVDDSILVIPIIVGKDSKELPRTHPCDKDGIDAEITAG